MQSSKTVPRVLLIAAAVSGCGRLPTDNGNGSDQDGERKAAISQAVPSTMVERASTVQLVMVTGSTDVDERPADGNHYRRFDFEVQTYSGTPVLSLIVPINYGGMGRLAQPPLPTELRFDSLQPGNRYWFLFGADFDPQKYPYPVLAWWPADQAPQLAAELAKEDAFHWHPTYHKSSGLSFGFETISPVRWDVIVKRAGKSLWRHEVVGTAVDDESLSPLEVYEGANYEMAPIDAPPDKQPVYLIYAMSRSDLADNNRFEIAPGNYRLRSAWELNTGKPLAEWVLPEKYPDDPLVMRQYRYGDGTLMLSARFEFIQSGGIQAGASTEAWLRKVVRRHNEGGEVLETNVYRHGSVKDEQERHSHNGWIPVD